MKIVVVDKTVETRDIAIIKKIDEPYEYGFIIHLKNNEKIEFREKLERTSWTCDRAAACYRWDRRFQETVDLWNKDKDDMPIVK